MKLESTRMKLLIVAIFVAVGREVAAYFGIDIPAETFLTIEGLILGLMGLDTARPLGKGYPVEASATPAPVSAEVPKATED